MPLAIGAGELALELAVVTGSDELALEVAVLTTADELVLAAGELPVGRVAGFEQPASGSSTTATRAANTVGLRTGLATGVGF